MRVHNWKQSAAGAAGAPERRSEQRVAQAKQAGSSGAHLLHALEGAARRRSAGLRRALLALEARHAQLREVELGLQLGGKEIAE